MTKIKLCGLTRPRDIEAANALRPDFIGFVFAPKSKRFLPSEKARELKRALSPEIRAVGVFVDEEPERVAALLNEGVIDLAQLHGSEDPAWLKRLRTLTDKPLIQAFRIREAEDLTRAEESGADYILLDSGAGSGEVFDWTLLDRVRRDYFLAGGLGPGNAEQAVRRLRPFAVDVSSGIESGGWKDEKKMAAFVAAVRKGDGL